VLASFSHPTVCGPTRCSSKLARLDGAIYPTALIGAATAFAAVITLVTTVIAPSSPSSLETRHCLEYLSDGESLTELHQWTSRRANYLRATAEGSGGAILSVSRKLLLGMLIHLAAGPAEFGAVSRTAWPLAGLSFIHREAPAILKPVSRDSHASSGS